MKNALCPTFGTLKMKKPPCGMAVVENGVNGKENAYIRLHPIPERVVDSTCC